MIHEKKSCEIDASRLREDESLEENMANLICYLDLVFKSIITSVVMCPQLMREAFALLKELSLKYFREREISYSVISGFIFLRFFAPAILSPKLFDITDQMIEPRVARTLTLMSKTVQMMGNIVSSKIVSPIRASLLASRPDSRSTAWLAFPVHSSLQRGLHE